MAEGDKNGMEVEQQPAAGEAAEGYFFIFLSVKNFLNTFFECFWRLKSFLKFLR